MHGNGGGVLGGVNGGLGSFLDAVTLQSGDFHDFASQRLGQSINFDGVASLADYVHHVDGHDHGDAQFGQLGGQIQVALQVGAVDDVQDGVGAFTDQIIPGDHFLQRVGGQGVDAGQVGDGDIAVLFQLAFLFLHRDAGPVADVLTGTGQGIEQGGFAAVRVARECDFNFHLCPSFC